MENRDGKFLPTADEVIRHHELLPAMGVDPDEIDAEGLEITVGFDRDLKPIAYVSHRVLMYKVNPQAAVAFLLAVQREDVPEVIETWQV